MYSSHIYKPVCALVLSASLLTSSASVAFAVQSPQSNVSSSVSFENDCIIEHVSVTEGDLNIYVERTTYKSGISRVMVNENGKISTFQCNADYNVLSRKLQSDDSVYRAQRKYDYRYLTTKERSYTLHADNHDVSTYMAILSGFCPNMPAKAIAAVATVIVYEVEKADAEKPDVDVTETITYYEVYNTAGEYLGYYYGEYDFTYSVEGGGTGSKTGSFETLTIL